MSKTRANTIHKQFHITPEMAEKFKNLAAEIGMSDSEILEAAVDLYYAQDVLPEHIIDGRLTQIQQQLTTMDRKLETLGGIFYQIMPYIFGILPPLPKNEVNADGNKYNPALDKGNEIFLKLIQGYRNQLKIHKISFVQNVWGDMLENLELTNVEKEKGDLFDRISSN